MAPPTDTVTRPRRRTQAERSAATTRTLTAAARRRFVRDGYAATSLDDVCAEAGMTKGALYHHFGAKSELFEAVFEAEQRRLCDMLEAAARTEDDPWDGFHAGAQAFLEACLDPAVRQITLLDAPAVLGWERMRAIEADHGLRLLREGLKASADDGRLRLRDVDGFAHLLFGALCEGAMYIARTPDQDAAMRRVWRDVRALLAGLAAA